jgi:hypothetical protein
MWPRSGGEKVYLEAIYPRPKFLATCIFASNAILLGFTASGCIVSKPSSLWAPSDPIISGVREQVCNFVHSPFKGYNAPAQHTRCRRT